MSDSTKIIERLDSLTGMNSADYLSQLKRSVESTIDNATSLRYRAAQVGENSIFMIDNSSLSSHVDVNFSHQKFLDINDESKSSLPDVTDKFRAMAGLFWTDKAAQSSAIYSDGETTNRSELIYLARDVVKLTDTHLPLKMHFNTLLPPENISGGIKEWILLEGKPNFAGGGQDSAAYLTATRFHERIVQAFDSVKNNPQFDHTLSVMQFSQKEDVEKQSSSVFYRYADIHGDYNYFDEIYERTIASNLVNETTIPNMYVFFAYQDSDNPNPAFHHHLTQDGKLNLSHHQDLLNGVVTNTQ